MAKNIKLLKMVTREDVLAEITSETETVLRIKNPVRVIIIPTAPQMQAGTERTPQIGFAPWVDFTTDKDFEIRKDHVLMTCEPLKEFISQYNTMFTGVILPQSNLITP